MPLIIKIELDSEGFCSIPSLTLAAATHPELKQMIQEDLYFIAATTPNNRYEIKGNLIRCRYGHSQLKISYEKSKPPLYLFHGTDRSQIASINRLGLLPGKRHYVHLSDNKEIARAYAKAAPPDVALITISTLAAIQARSSFYCVGKSIWLIEQVALHGS